MKTSLYEMEVKNGEKIVSNICLHAGNRLDDDIDFTR